MARTELEQIDPADRTAWRRWLQEHHDTAQGVWLILHKKSKGSQPVTIEEAVLEALCFGWIDSVSRPVPGGGKRAQRFTPRRPGGNWSAVNKERVERLIADGLMTEAGLKAIETAKRNGAWSRLDAVERLEVPADLAAALAADPPAEANFAAFAPSARKMTLAWVISAKRPETRARRIAETVELSRRGLTLAQRPASAEPPRRSGTRP